MTPDNFSIAISKEQVAALPKVGFKGDITLIDKLEQVAEAVQYIRSQDVVGFDTETKPSFKKGQTNRVSLMQIATAERSFLFRLNKIGFVQELKDFMECDDVLKVGLSLKDDFHVLQKLGSFEPSNFVEIQEMVKRFHITDASLQKIYAILFHARISKTQRLTNWEAPTLTQAQMVYASIDAWACLKIYRKLAAGDFDPAQSQFIVKPEPEAQEGAEQ